MVRRLSGGSDHDPAADLVSDFLQVIKAPLPVLNRKLRRMQIPVMRRIRGFLPEQVTVRPRLKIPQIAFPCLFPDRERDSTVRVSVFDSGHQAAQIVVPVKRILAALQNDGAESQLITLVGAGKDLFGTQPVSLRPGVGTSEPAIVTVIPAIAAELDQSAQKNSLPVIKRADLTGLPEKKCLFFLRHALQEDAHLLARKRFLFPENPDSFHIGCHGSSSFLT